MPEADNAERVIDPQIHDRLMYLLSEYLPEGTDPLEEVNFVIPTVQRNEDGTTTDTFVYRRAPETAVAETANAAGAENVEQDTQTAQPEGKATANGVASSPPAPQDAKEGSLLKFPAKAPPTAKAAPAQPKAVKDMSLEEQAAHYEATLKEAGIEPAVHYG